MQKHLQSMIKKGELPSSPKRQAILVLGMHRSGTSALGGVINTMGAAGPKTLIPANAFNPRGFFESLPLVIAHDELLASAGSCWHDWRQLNPQWIHSKAAARHRQKIKALLIDEFGDEPLIFIKDPRICRFVPFMASILAEMKISPVAFLPVRNPLGVAYSLKRRDEIALPKSLLLWLRHVLEAEYHSRHMPRSFLSFEKLLIDWRYHIDRAAKETGVIWPARSDRSDVKVDRFLALDLHHEKIAFDEIQNHPKITSLFRETFNILTTIVANGENKDMLDQLDLVRTKFDEVCELFGVAVATEELAVEQLRCERDGLARTHTDLIAERAVLAGHYAAMTAERDALARDHEHLIAERDALARAHNDLIVERNTLARCRDAAIGERNALVGSQSWRLTAPLRALRRLFSQ